MKELKLKDQGDLYYTISKDNAPKLRVEAGENFVIETQDAFSGQIRKDTDRRDLKAIPYPNPQSGPIYVNGAKSGDTLVVKIGDIQPLIGQGSTRIVSLSYTSKYDTELIQRFLGDNSMPNGTKVCAVKDGKVHFERFEIPYRPMIGTLSTADSVESYIAWLPGPYGGNMDIPAITTGATLYLPVKVDGALLHIGDIHAVQGDGEASGAAVEMPARVELQVDLIRDSAINWPRLENEEMISVIACMQAGRDLQDTIRLGFLELALWLEKDYSMDRWLAFELLSLVAQIRIGNFWTATVGIPKKYLKQRK